MNEITSSEAVTIIRLYFERMGQDPDSIEWSEKPSGLPENIDKAWDIFLEDAKATSELYNPQVSDVKEKLAWMK